MKTKKFLTTSLKILVTLGLLYYVFQKIDLQDIISVLRQSKPQYLFGALVCFLLSQWISAIRLLNFFRIHQYDLSAKSNIILYLVGMFYNFFIPGGIGGDAYKVYLLHKNFQWNVKSLGLALLNDRISGLFAILLLAQIMGFFILNGILLYSIPISFILTLGLFYLFQKKIFPIYRPIAFKSLFLSCLVQLLQVFCVIFILKSFSQNENFILYSIVFLLSSILSILSFSGIGLREWLFMKVADMYSFQSDIAVSIALVFSILTIAVSFLGIFFNLSSKGWLKTSKPSSMN